MSTSSAASDAEDEEMRHTAAGTSSRSPGGRILHRPRSSYSEEETDGDGVGAAAGRELQQQERDHKGSRQIQRHAANARERARMRVLSRAFSRLKTSLPWVPADTKLSKLDTLRLASSYISHLRHILQEDHLESSFTQPLSLSWPFLMTGRSEDDMSSSMRLCGTKA